VEAEQQAAPDAPEGTDNRFPRTKVFRKRSNTPVLAPERVERQSRIARIAFEALGREDAVSFLNTHDDAFGGRPLDLAMESEDGMRTIEAAIRERGLAGPPRGGAA
jgi:hypothetical protein